MGGQQRDTAQRAIERLQPPPLDRLESVPPGPDLSDDRIASSLERARERLRQIAERAGGEGAALTDEQAKVLADAEAALRRLSAQGDQAEITDDQLIGLEAVIVPDGTRPALFVQDDAVNAQAPDAGFWSAQIANVQAGIRETARSVGRINISLGFTDFAGTGFVVAPGLIMTNRHVLEFLAGSADP
jgi:hypothetical protein